MTIQIVTEQDHERALTEIEALMMADPAGGTPEAERLTRLATAVEAYERVHFPLPPVHPGRMISEYLESKNWTEADLARYTGIPIETVANLCGEQCSITPFVAATLEQVFSRPESFWLALQRRYDEDTIARLKSENGRVNVHRTAAVRARLRCSELERAIKWCRGRIAVLEIAVDLERAPVASAAVNDVIQIHPEHRALGGCLAFVTEARGWGVIAEVLVPGRGVAPVRLERTEFVRIGKAGWIREDEP